MTNKYSFEQEEAVKNTRGLKIGNNKSKFQDEMDARLKTQKQKEEFEKRADQFMENRKEKEAKAIDLAVKFMSALRDKTLKQNKTPLVNEYEDTIKTDLYKFIVEANNDPEEENDGMGSATVMLLLIKALFEMRDSLNEKEYEIEKLKTEISSLVIKA